MVPEAGSDPTKFFGGAEGHPTNALGGPEGSETTVANNDEGSHPWRDRGRSTLGSTEPGMPNLTGERVKRTTTVDWKAKAGHEISPSGTSRMPVRSGAQKAGGYQPCLATRRMGGNLRRRTGKALERSARRAADWRAGKVSAVRSVGDSVSCATGHSDRGSRESIPGTGSAGACAGGTQLDSLDGIQPSVGKPYPIVSTSVCPCQRVASLEEEVNRLRAELAEAGNRREAAEKQQCTEIGTLRQDFQAWIVAAAERQCAENKALHQKVEKCIKDIAAVTETVSVKIDTKVVPLDSKIDVLHSKIDAVHSDINLIASEIETMERRLTMKIEAQRAIVTAQVDELQKFGGETLGSQDNDELCAETDDSELSSFEENNAGPSSSVGNNDSCSLHSIEEEDTGDNANDENKDGGRTVEVMVEPSNFLRETLQCELSLDDDAWSRLPFDIVVPLDITIQEFSDTVMHEVGARWNFGVPLLMYHSAFDSYRSGDRVTRGGVTCDTTLAASGWQALCVPVLKGIDWDRYGWDKRRYRL
mmetsp:Transcript_9347/g.21850  ORF Transcript_9347/g.21850 Transcript_9347/m.21850 type:complete len:531 (+) Transcript_9347:124-1716(+)